MRQILVVDDDDKNLKFLQTILLKEGYRVEIAASGEEGLKKFREVTPDLVLLDVNMPGMSGLETLKVLREGPSYVAVIFVSGNTLVSEIVEGLDQGADDYIRKPFDVYELLARVRAKLRIKDLHDQLKVVNKKLEDLVDIDDLTGLFNMRSFYQRLEHEIDRTQRNGNPVAVIMMDLDDFKKVNDKHDHLFGSFVLTEIGELIRVNIRSIDFAARYGGDEFVVVVTDTTVEGCRTFAERLRRLIADRVFKNDKDQMQLTVSLGFSVFTADQKIDSRGLVRLADRALYDAKNSGKNCVKQA